MGTARRLAPQFLFWLFCNSITASPPDSTAYSFPVFQVQASRIGPRELLDRQGGFATLLESDLWQDGSGELSSVLSRALGVQMRSRGGLGASASLGVRGSASHQVPVYLDGVLLNDPNDGGVDLGAVDLSSLERVEVHRSGAPLLQGGSSLGGAIHLFTRGDAMRPRLLAGGGDFGERFVEAGGSFPLSAQWSLSAQTRFARGEGDWEAFDDKGTIYNANDDEWTERVNNDAQTVALLLRARGTWRGGELSVVEQFRRRELGDPGPLHHEPSRVRYGERSQRLQASWSKASGRLRSLRAHHRVELPFFRDPGSEFGYPSDQHARIDQFGTGMLGAVRSEGRPLWRLDARSERLRSSDDAQLDGDGKAQWRHSLELALEPQWQRGPWRLIAGGAIALHHERFHQSNPSATLATGELRTRSRATETAQLGLRRQLTGSLAFKASSARSERLPSMAELYGTRGGVLGNPSLRPESAWSFDAGFVFAPTRGARVEFVLFQNLYDDLISFRPISARSVKAANIAGARSRGAELSIELPRWSIFDEQLQVQFLDTEDRSDDQIARGKSLVGRPRYDLTQRLGASWRGIRCEYEIVAIGESWYESGERNRISPQLLHGARASLRKGRAQLNLHLANLGDERVSDVWRYPLPGRSLHISLSLLGVAP